MLDPFMRPRFVQRQDQPYADQGWSVGGSGGLKRDADRLRRFLQIAVESRQRETSSDGQVEVARVVRSEFLVAGEAQDLIEGAIR